MRKTLMAMRPFETTSNPLEGFDMNWDFLTGIPLIGKIIGTAAVVTVLWIIVVGGFPSSVEVGTAKGRPTKLADGFKGVGGTFLGIAFVLLFSSGVVALVFGALDMW